ncbi:MAG: hypothetical protein D6675_11375 [Gemmatimonadetes bacterium]|nr:MAG: hypothetical protein D6675_11375 [Gemmatimonadota bacterium]
MIRINLLPPEDRGKGADIEEISGGGGLNLLDLRILIPAVVLVVVVMGIFIWWRSLEGQKADLNQQIAEVNAELSRRKAEKQKVEALEEKRTMTNERLREVERLDQNRFYWVQVMEQLAHSLPEQVWITEIRDQSSAGRPAILLKGEAFSNVRVAELIYRLERSDIVADPADIELMSSRTGQKQRTLVGDYQLYEFEMRIKLVAPESLGAPLAEDHS